MYRVIYIADGGPEVEFVDGPCPELWVRQGELALCCPFDDEQEATAREDPSLYFDAHSQEAFWDARAAVQRAQESADAMDATVCALYEAMIAGGE